MTSFSGGGGNGGRETLTFGSRIVLAHKEHHTNRLVVALCICEFIGYTLYILTYLPNSFAPVNARYRQVRRILCDVKIPLSGNKQKAQLFPTLKLLS